MLLIALTDGRNIRATRATPSDSLFEIIEEGGRRLVVNRHEVAGIGETPDHQSTSIEHIGVTSQRPDLLLLARQALNLSSFFMDKLIHGDDHVTEHWSTTSLEMDSENICRYFDRR